MVVWMNEERRVGATLCMRLADAAEVDVQVGIAVQDEEGVGKPRQRVCKCAGCAARRGFHCVLDAEVVARSVADVRADRFVAVVDKQQHPRKAVDAAQIELVIEDGASEQRDQRLRQVARPFTQPRALPPGEDRDVAAGAVHHRLSRIQRLATSQRAVSRTDDSIVWTGAQPAFMAFCTSRNTNGLSPTQPRLPVPNSSRGETPSSSQIQRAESRTTQYAGTPRW